VKRQLRIADFGLRIRRLKVGSHNPQSTIRNPQSGWGVV